MGQSASSRALPRSELGPDDLLSRLPPELLGQVLTHLPKADLAHTALVSKHLYRLSSLLIYRQVLIGWKEPAGTLPLVWFQRWKPEKQVKGMLAKLTNKHNRSLVSALRKLTVANYEWYDQRKMDRLELILIRANANLRELEFVSLGGRVGEPAEGGHSGTIGRSHPPGRMIPLAHPTRCE